MAVPAKILSVILPKPRIPKLMDTKNKVRTIEIILTKNVVTIESFAFSWMVFLAYPEVNLITKIPTTSTNNAIIIAGILCKKLIQMCSN